MYMCVGAQLHFGNGTKFTSHVENDILVLVCNATGLDMETDIKFTGPNAYNRPCPKSSSAYVFPDGTTTRFHQNCMLIVRKLTLAYVGKYHCEAKPLQDDSTCHDFTSNVINVTINPDNSSSGPDIGMTIAVSIVGGIALCMFIATLSMCFCYFRKRE